MPKTDAIKIEELVGSPETVGEESTPVVVPKPDVVEAKTPAPAVVDAPESTEKPTPKTVKSAAAKSESDTPAAEKLVAPEPTTPVTPVEPIAPAPSSETTESVAAPKTVPVAPLRPRSMTTRDLRNFPSPTPLARRLAADRLPEKDAPTITLKGVLDTTRDGHGVLRTSFALGEKDAYISSSQIRRFRLRAGDMIEGPAREPKENERYWGLLKVDVVNGVKAEELAETDRIKFHSLTPVYPDQQIMMETGEEPLSLRIIDLVAPIGKGQRSLIVSPPKAGKTTLLKDIATGIAANHPEIHVMAVLVGERPEEVTDIRRHIERITKSKGEVAASNFDEPAEDQCRVAELALERAKRLVEMGRDVVILLDSITRLARAYNLSIPTSGRTLSGGFDPAALFPPKKFFGAARNFEVSGSLTIIGTALVETGSRMDDLIYEEFKGTGNQEVTLDRRLAERRIYPAIDVQRSGTRRDDLLFDPVKYQSVMTLQRMLDMLDKEERTTTLISQMKRSKTNKEFLASLKGG